MKLFTSDLHFDHKNIVKFTGRPTDIEHHSDWLCDLWNYQVGTGDIVYHLGDFSFATEYEQVANHVSRLNGNKIFIKGNHDNRQFLQRLVQDKLIAAWYEYHETTIAKHPVVLFHFPISSWHKQIHGSWHLYGHCHGTHHHDRGKMLDVGLDSAYNVFNEFRLFTEDDVAQYMNRINDDQRTRY